MPSSISTVRPVGVPSSSIESEPRREDIVPSSTTVTPLAATCWPIRPAKADVFLRLKSPSSPWPTASCSITQRAVGGIAPVLRFDEARIALAPAIALRAALLPVALSGHHGDIDAHKRTD